MINSIMAYPIKIFVHALRPPSLDRIQRSFGDKTTIFFFYAETVKNETVRSDRDSNSESR